MTAHKAKASGMKKQDVLKIRKLFKEYKVVGLVNMEYLPAYELMKIKRSLRNKVILMMPKKRIIKIALEEIQLPGIAEFSKQITGMPALLFTNENPFALYKLVAKNKSMASAKPGQIAPYDLSVPAGPTPFTPGPMIGELGQLGLKTMVKDGKIE
ncbi:MAG TPA: 50S ribosomal protein L10, partial [Candidatus Nanoarchaeia archaeon]|nr:50S ribosomal protein L10 [Candidatus Nanoarchaeia archaeon]